MKSLRRLRISYSRKIQPKQFESMGLEVSLEKDILDTDDLTVEASKSVNALRTFVSNKLIESLQWEKEKLK